MSKQNERLPDFDRLVEALRLVGHPLRLSILSILARQEHAVGDLVTETGQSPSLISQQLALLRKAGLIQGRREAKQVFYTVAGGRLSEVGKAISGLVDQNTNLAGSGHTPNAAPQEGFRVSAAMFAQISPRP